MASRVTDTVARTLDDTKDYVYLIWDDNKLREYLESKGVQVKEQAQKSRNDLPGKMRDAYAKVTQPVWEASGEQLLPCASTPFSYVALTPRQHENGSSCTTFSLQRLLCPIRPSISSRIWPNTITTPTKPFTLRGQSLGPGIGSSARRHQAPKLK